MKRLLCSLVLLSAAYCCRTFVADAAPRDAPWCFWYGAQEPHREYEFQSGVDKGGKKLPDIVFDSYKLASGDGLYEKFMRGEKVNTGWVNPTDVEQGPVKPPFGPPTQEKELK